MASKIPSSSSFRQSQGVLWNAVLFGKFLISHLPECHNSFQHTKETSFFNKFYKWGKKSWEALSSASSPQYISPIWDSGAVDGSPPTLANWCHSLQMALLTPQKPMHWGCSETHTWEKRNGKKMLPNTELHSVSHRKLHLLHSYKFPGSFSYPAVRCS